MIATPPKTEAEYAAIAAERERTRRRKLVALETSRARAAWDELTTWLIGDDEENWEFLDALESHIAGKKAELEGNMTEAQERYERMNGGRYVG